jgi:hypothetical protein
LEFKKQTLEEEIGFADDLMAHQPERRKQSGRNCADRESSQYIRTRAQTIDEIIDGTKWSDRSCCRYGLVTPNKIDTVLGNSLGFSDDGERDRATSNRSREI